MNFKTLLTDNATLTDASVAFESLEKGHDISKSILPNLMKFLESSILYDKMVADEKVFNNQQWTQKLKSNFDHVDGIKLENNLRRNINSNANQIIKRVQDNLPVNNEEFIYSNEFKGNLKRLLFYLGISEKMHITYSPSNYRNSILSNVSNFYKPTETKTTIETKLLENIIASAQQYSERVFIESGIQLVIAELPPISALVIAKAIQCGSWREAIYEIKNNKTAQDFRNWAYEVSVSLSDPSSNALKKLIRVNNFIKGWGQSGNDGLSFKVNFAIGSLLNIFKIPVKTDEISFEIPNPFPSNHIVFLNDTYKSILKSEENLGKLKNIKI